MNELNYELLSNECIPKLDDKSEFLLNSKYFLLLLFCFYFL